MVVPEEEIESWIKEMGYMTVKPRAIYPSYYKLSDGTVIRALVNINYIIPNPKTPDGFTVNSNNIISAYVPKEKRNPAAFQPYNPAELRSGIIEEDMEAEPLRENFSVYELSNGMVMSVKTVAGQISKTKYFTPDGEPVYIVNINPIVKIKKS
ncbi:MAG: hypothetical protein QXE84_03310 [Candidatus Nitrosotenuis sp.]|nr:hypothetical protein [Candidatus Nitrosotenuis sp.]